MSELQNRLSEITAKKDYKLIPEIPNKNLLIEITNKCNCNCIFCANSKMIRSRKNIDDKFIYKVLNEAYELGVREVGFYTTGESMLNENLYDYIKYAKTIGYNYVYLTTNGILLDENSMIKLVKNGIDSIKISINAINKEDYKLIHGVDCFNLVINNLKYLFNFREKNKLPFKIYVSYIATKYTDYKINVIRDFFIKYCDDVAIINVRNQSGMMPEINDLLLCEEDATKVQGRRLVPCHYVFDTINITSEGYITACCTDFENYLAYADLNKVSIKEAWTNELITLLRKKHLENKLEGTLCANCIYDSKICPSALSKEYVEIDNFEKVLYNDKVTNRLKKYKKL